MFNYITECRACGSKNLKTVLSLGEQYLTGVFPKNTENKLSKGPLDLVFCEDCHLLQMKESYSLDEMYGMNYGYRSGLNKSMVSHLQDKIQKLEKFVDLNENDIVIDIGSNDATSLKVYSKKCRKVGIDPTGIKFKEFYTDDITLIPDFFSHKKFDEKFPSQKAKIITSIAMFYDLEHPLDFINDIFECLDEEGIWHFEQSYMPAMIRTTSYDTICHEHLEFYSFEVIHNMLSQCGLKIIDVSFNSINGGSFAVAACKKNASYKANSSVITWLLRQEKNWGFDTLKPYQEFEKKVFNHRTDIKDLISLLVADGKKVFGYGASTKGNVLLQFCEIGKDLIPYIAEVNPDKYGAYTPGTNIPIISEDEAKKMKPDYFFVLPWHFKNNILEREKDFINDGGKFIFPLPEIEIV